MIRANNFQVLWYFICNFRGFLLITFVFHALFAKFFGEKGIFLSKQADFAHNTTKIEYKRPKIWIFQIKVLPLRAEMVER